MIASMLTTPLSTPIGGLVLVGDGESLTQIQLPGRHRPVAGAARDDSAFAEPIDQLERYFAGELREFDLALAPRRGEFDLAVWEELTASRTARPPATARWPGHRPPGLAAGRRRRQRRNPIPIVVPCHRVIGATASSSGYGGGLETKRALLELEAGVRQALAGRQRHAVATG